MKRLRHDMGKAGHCRKRLKALASLLTAFSLLVAQSHSVLADIFNSATATANYQTSTINSAPATASVPLTPAAPSFAITKTVDVPSIGAPGTLSYEIQVRNTGNVSLTAPTLTDVLVQGATSLTLTSGPALVSGDAAAPGVLDTGETWIYSASYAVTQADIDRGASIVNTATFDTAETGPSSAAATTNISQAPSIALTKTGTFNAGSDGIANAGDTITYTFAVTNTGSVMLTNVTLADSGATITGGPIASLVPGATDITSFSGTYVLTQADIAAGSYANTATVAGTPPTGPNVTNSASATTGFSTSGSVAIIKSSSFIDANGDGFAQVGETIRYTFGVKNISSVTLSNVSVTDPLVTVSGRPITLRLGEEDTTTFTGIYTLTATDIAAGRVTNSAEVTATTSDNSIVRDISDSTDLADGPNPASYGAGIGSDDPTVELLRVQSASVTGTVFFDLNSNGILDGDPSAGAGYIVELLDASGQFVGTAITNADGTYSINATPGTGYTIIFKLPGGGTIGRIENLTLAGGQTLIDQNLPIDPSGVVYNSVTRQPVPGVIVTITDADGNPLPEACLLPGQQNQVTGPSGIYRFDIKPSPVLTACPIEQKEYRLRLTAPSGYLPGFSTLIPAQAGALDVSACPIDAVPAGSCQVSGSSGPPSSGSGIYYLRFLIGASNPDVVNNHLPIDPVTVKAPSFTKTAAINNVRRGERVPFKIAASDVALGTARITDIMPPGFGYVNGSARVNGKAQDPKVSGQTLTFNDLARDSERTIRIELLLVAVAAVATGIHVNTAQFIDPANGTVLATAKASVEVVPEPVFDCGEVIGRVFDDKNRNGYQDKGEDGLPGVRVATVKGLLLTTDKAGRFHVACADIPDADIGSNFLMKLDTRTLPTGYRLTTENPRDVRLTRGKITKLNFGAAITRIVRLDLKDDAFEPGTANLKPKWSGGIDKLIAILDKEPSTLRLTYTSEGNKKFVSKRLMAIEKLVATRWRKRPGRYELPIESRVMGTK